MEVGQSAQGLFQGSIGREALGFTGAFAAGRRVYSECDRRTELHADARRKLSRSSGPERLGPFGDDERSRRIGRAWEPALWRFDRGLGGWALSPDAVFEKGSGSGGGIANDDVTCRKPLRISRTRAT